jgi:hypothetical protein
VSGKPKDGAEYFASDAFVTTTVDMDGNPSERRNGVEIRFWCENCHATAPAYVAAQSETHLHWAEPIEVRSTVKS